VAIHGPESRALNDERRPTSTISKSEHSTVTPEVAGLSPVAPANPSETGPRFARTMTLAREYWSPSRHIFQKLDVRDRVRLVVLAYQTGLFDPPPGLGPDDSH
jgi:hypothetical protein